MMTFAGVFPEECDVIEIWFILLLQTACSAAIYIEPYSTRRQEDAVMFQAHNN